MIRAYATIRMNVGNEHLRLPARPAQAHDTVPIDPRRNTRICYDQKRLAVFHCPKNAAAEMEVEHRRAPKPAVVGHVDEHIGRRAAAGKLPELHANEMRNG